MKTFILTLCSMLAFFSPISAEEPVLVEDNFSLFGDSKTVEVKKQDPTDLKFFHILESASFTEIVLKDGTHFDIGFWFYGHGGYWKQGDRLKISYHFNPDYNNHVQIQNIDAVAGTTDVVWASLGAYKTPKNVICNSLFFDNPHKEGMIVLQSGWIFGESTKNMFYSNGWNVNDYAIILHDREKENVYAVWNMRKNQIVENLILVGFVNDPLIFANE